MTTEARNYFLLLFRYMFTIWKGLIALCTNCEQVLRNLLHRNATRQHLIHPQVLVLNTGMIYCTNLLNNFVVQNMPVYIVHAFSWRVRVHGVGRRNCRVLIFWLVEGGTWTLCSCDFNRLVTVHDVTLCIMECRWLMCLGGTGSLPVQLMVFKVNMWWLYSFVFAFVYFSPPPPSNHGNLIYSQQ